VKAKIRHRRTLFLGVLATVVFVWAAITRFDVPAEEMARLFVYCILGVLTTMVLAALTVAVLVGLKRLARASGLLRPPPE
jgi:hypothetical protein